MGKLNLADCPAPPPGWPSPPAAAGHPPYLKGIAMSIVLIAEAATNHGGDLKKARDMVWAASRAGADYVKFQAWQVKNIKNPTRRDIERELSDRDLLTLRDEADCAGIQFLVSVFDRERIPFVREQLGCKEVKVPSQDLTAWKLLEDCASTFDRVYLSTGMSKFGEIERAKMILGFRGILLHCVSKYPCPLGDACLEKIRRLGSIFSPVGYSDHCLGIDVALAAAYMGAEIIEVHFSLDKDPADAFNIASKSPGELATLATRLHELPVIIGNGSFELTPEDRAARRQWKNYRGQNHDESIMSNS